jgi:hypothetical protein
MPNVTLEYYGVIGTGKNVTEAKRDAGEQIRKALDGDYSPALIHWRQYTVLVWREPKLGWGYRISHPDAQGAEIYERMWLSYSGENREEVLLSLVKHIADIARPIGEDPKESLPFFQILHHREAVNAYREFADTCRRNDQFQRRHRHAVDVLHMASNDAHNWAGMNPSTWESWKGTESLFAIPEWETA